MDWTCSSSGLLWMDQNMTKEVTKLCLSVLCPPSANYHTVRRIKVSERQKEQGLVLVDSKNLAVFE